MELKERIKKIKNDIFDNTSIKYTIDKKNEIISLVNIREEKLTMTFFFVEEIIDMLGKEEARETIYLLYRCDPKWNKNLVKV